MPETRFNSIACINVKLIQNMCKPMWREEWPTRWNIRNVNVDNTNWYDARNDPVILGIVSCLRWCQVLIKRVNDREPYVSSGHGHGQCVCSSASVAHQHARRWTTDCWLREGNNSGLINVSEVGRAEKWTQLRELWFETIIIPDNIRRRFVTLPFVNIPALEEKGNQRECYIYRRNFERERAFSFRCADVIFKCEI